jgi:oligopeptide/dipeptide ABC transporter ATP-binding protein
MNNPILEVRNLKKYFPVKTGKFADKAACLKAVDDISFTIQKGTTVGLIGESGCGKSTVARLITKLIAPTAGSIKIQGQEIANLNRTAMTAVRRKVQMVFQDPYSSLDPRKTAGFLIQEPLVIHHVGAKKERQERVEHLLKVVGLDYYHGNRYPHEFSGGQRQRISIARALALDPELVICDEPVSALDVSIQAQVINLLRELQAKLQLTYLFVSHDLSVVKYLSDSLMVMYLGKIVESGNVTAIYKNPLHPYTKALFASIPVESPLDTKARNFLNGDVPSPLSTFRGCLFHTRCSVCMDQCRETAPELRELEAGHQVACHLY